jgi:nitrate reductase NapAB chaperone NapD
MYIYMIYHICSLVIQHNPANCQGLVEIHLPDPQVMASNITQLARGALHRP